MPEDKKKFQLSDMSLDEISLVDRGANQHARVVLMKRDSCETEKSCDEDLEKAPPKGIQFVIGFKEGGGSEVQSVIFNTDNWDEDKAKAWLKDHDMSSGKVDKPESGNTLRFRQKSPEDYTRFRVIRPGAQLSKALKAKNSWQRMQALVDAAVREKFQPKMQANQMPTSYVYIRDFFQDSAVFEQDGKTYRVEYEISYDAEGEPSVLLGAAVPVDVVYQDVGKAKPKARTCKCAGCGAEVSLAADADCTKALCEKCAGKVKKDGEQVPVELEIRLGLAKANMALLGARFGKMNPCHSAESGQFCSTGTGGGGGGLSAADQRYRNKIESVGGKLPRNVQEVVGDIPVSYQGRIKLTREQMRKSPVKTSGMGQVVQTDNAAHSQALSRKIGIEGFVHSSTGLPNGGRRYTLFEDSSRDIGML